MPFPSQLMLIFEVGDCASVEKVELLSGQCRMKVVAVKVAQDTIDA